MAEFEHKLDAQEEAEEVRKQLGDNWKIRVWHNFGWHYCVYLEDNGSNGGSFGISRTSEGKYTCRASTGSSKGSGWGSGHLAFFGRTPYGDTPIEALKAALGQICMRLTQLQSLHAAGVETIKSSQGFNKCPACGSFMAKIKPRLGPYHWCCNKCGQLDYETPA